MSDPNDKLLDEYLRRESPVSQRYRELEAEDVPPQLDAAILSQARAAVEQRAVRKPSWLKWGAPLALAASAVMVVAIVLEVGVQEEVRLPEAQIERASAPAERSPEAYVVEQMIQEAPVAVPMAPAAETQADAVIEEPVTASDDQDAVKPQAPTTAPQAGVASSSEAEAAKSIVREPIRRRAVADSVKLDAPPPPPDAEASERRTAARREQAEESRDAMFKRSVPPPAAAPSVTTVSAAAPVAGPRLEPEAWLERIRELRREGKAIEADEQWREFEKAYPQYEVSETDAARPKP